MALIRRRSSTDSPSLGTAHARLVEVKGPGDRLSDAQLAWMHVLLDVGADVEVAYVERCA